MKWIGVPRRYSLLKVGLAHCCLYRVITWMKMNKLETNFSRVSMFWRGPAGKMKQYSVFSALEFTVFPHPKDKYFTMF